MCELLNISRRSIQCYEKAGLMTPTTKNKYGHLLYDESAFHRAEMIRFLQQLRFKLREVKEIIDAPDDVIKEALEKRVDELEHEKVKMDQIMQEARDYIEKLSYENGGNFYEQESCNSVWDYISMSGFNDYNAFSPVCVSNQ